MGGWITSICCPSRRITQWFRHHRAEACTAIIGLNILAYLVNLNYTHYAPPPTNAASSDVRDLSPALDPQKNDAKIISKSPIFSTGDNPWLVERLKLLEKNGDLRKVYLFAYMRGGSTLLGQVFNQDPDCMYWYEPLNMFYGAHFGIPDPRDTYDTIYNNDKEIRKTEEWEKKELLEYIRAMFECRLKDMPPDAMGCEFIEYGESPKMASYVKCYKTKFLEDIHSTVHWSKDMSGLKGVSSEPVSQLRMKRYGDLCPDTSRASQYCGMGKHVDRAVKRAIDNKCPEQIAITNDWLSNTSMNYGDLRRMYEERHVKFDEKQVSSFLSNAECVKAKQKRVNSCLATTGIVEECAKSNIRAVKILRVKMSNFEFLIRNIPDMHVIHSVRDPRAIVHSKLSLFGSCHPRNECFEDLVPAYCQEIWNDIKGREELEKSYPGVFLQIRYEDLVLKPMDTFQTMFNFIGRNVSAGTKEWFYDITNSKKDGGRFTVLRHDGKSLVTSWKGHYTTQSVEKISRDPTCKMLFEKLGYPLS